MTAVTQEAVTQLARQAGNAGPAQPRGRPSASRWRALLEARWRHRLEELTDVSVAFHDAGAQAPATEPPESLRLLTRRAVTARYALAEIDKALGRLAAGEFGRCEDCGGEIPAPVLLNAPEARYCQRCA